MKFRTQSYLADPNLKRAGVQVSFTLEQAEEYLKCQNDPIYFIEKYIKVISLDKGIVPFDMYDFQKELVNLIHNNRFVCAMCTRQIGKTTTYIGYLLHQILFRPHWKAGIGANKATTAKKIIASLKLAYKAVPLWMQQGVVEFNKTCVELENGSGVVAAATSSGALRSWSLNMLVLDEFAHVPKEVADEFLSSVYPVISSGTTTKILIISTPKGIGNAFYKIWVDARNGKNLYKTAFYTWRDVPGRTQAWADEQRKQLGAVRYAQEIECEFLGSSRTLIAGGELKNITFSDPISSADNLDVWEVPVPGHTYVVPVDSGDGVGGDFSVFAVVDVTECPYRVVAKYRNNAVSPTEYPDTIVDVATRYNTAYVLPECNDMGAVVADNLVDTGYGNLMYTVNTTGKTQISSGFVPKARVGVKTNYQVKSTGCTYLKELIEGHKLIINDFEILQELTTFSSKKKSFEAEPGCHDDLAMVLVLFSWFSVQPYFKDIVNPELAKKVEERTKKLAEQSVLPFGRKVDGSELAENGKTFVADGCVWTIV